MPSDYFITITRNHTDHGELRYRGSFEFTCRCDWDPPDQIPAGHFPGCSATYMSSAKNSAGGKREAIFLPNVPGRTGIFLHYWPGTGLSVWSDGCILLLEPNILKIWKDILPKDGRNVTVEVLDDAPGGSRLPVDMRNCTPGRPR